MVAFVNSFLTYLLLLVIMAAIAGFGLFVGILLRKGKNAKAAVEEVKAENKQ